MSGSFEFDDEVVLVTGGCGALGSAVAASFDGAGATVCVTDVVEPGDDEAQIDADRVDFDYFRGDLTEEDEAQRIVEAVVAEHGRLDVLCNIAGTWAGGSPIHQTDVETFDMLMAVNLKTMFLATKQALPHLQETGGAVVSVSARSSLEGGTGDGPYRAAKAGVRLLTETVAEENLGTVRANAIMPSVIDTPMNRDMMPDVDHSAWVDPTDIADVVLFLCSDAASVTRGAAVPVYGEA